MQINDMNISMKTVVLVCLITVSFIPVIILGQNKEKVTPYVNPFIGTGAVENSLSGSTYPGATAPFGFIQLSPDTKESPEWGEPSGYDHNVNKIYGFSHTHLSGTGVADFFDIMLMPVTRSLEELTRTFDYSSGFSHDNESAKAGYYQVRLSESDINVELTATTRTGMHRYTYPKGKANTLVFDMNHSRDKSSWNTRINNAQVRIIDRYTIEGYRVISGWAKLRKVYFYAKLSRPVKEAILMSDDHIYKNGEVANGSNVRAFLSFENSDTPLMVKVALSPVSKTNAAENMKENTSWDFNNVMVKTNNEWERELSKIMIEGTPVQKEIFYTALYHAFIQPNTFSDSNGEYQTIDYTTRKLENGETHYSTFSLWDSYRATHPLYTILQPERSADFVNSLLRQYDDYGYLPIWQLWGQENYCMIGNHSIPVVVDAVFKNIKNINVEKVYDAVKNSSIRSHLNAPYDIWEKYGYMPENLQTQSVSLTLEMAYNDWCVAQLAKHLSKTADYEHFIKRSRFYRNIFNKDTGFFWAKDDKGNWLKPFNPLKYGANGGYPVTEGNTWQYLWYVPQNLPDFIRLMGGDKAFENKLDQFFTLESDNREKNHNASGFIGQYAHGNEPSHHVTYLYNYVGAPQKTQYYVSKVMNELYNNTFSGYSGNEDCGQMSVWYIFSSMGFYPVNPVTGIYVFGSPLLEQAVISLPEGKTFTMKAPKKSDKDIYIQFVTLNGVKYDKTYIRHQDIMKGGILEFKMGSKPSKWGSNTENRPPNN
jgi:predicted alpha-1,2-mannosidase